jgi:hypothetical protein
MTVAACFVFREKLTARILGLLQHYPPTGDIAQRPADRRVVTQ